MTVESQGTEARMQSLIDALVCGELDDGDRRQLLAWLDSDAARWRACGLAFLEAQMWEEALNAEGPAFGVQRLEGYQRREAARAMRPAGGGRWLTPLAVVAASIAAFACGLVCHEFWRPRRESSPPIARPELPPRPAQQSSGPLVASVPVKGGPLGEIATLHFPVRTVDSRNVPAASAVPEHVRKLWERRGYELVEERRYLPARLPDGRSVMVPVNEVKMKFVGRPVS